MATSDSDVWSTLGYGALSYYWGVPFAEVDRLPDDEKARLTRLTRAVQKMSDTERAPILARLEAVSESGLLSALQFVATELSV